MKKAFIVPIVLTMAFLALGFFALPQYQNFKRLEKRVVEKQSQLDETERYLAQLEQILTTVGTHQESLEKIQAALPEEVSLASLLNYFQKASSESGLLLKNISLVGLALAGTGQSEQQGEVEVTDVVSGPKVEKSSFSLELFGSYSSLKSFVQALEKSARLIEINNVSVSLEDDEEEKGLLRFNLLISVHSQQ